MKWLSKFFKGGATSRGVSTGSQQPQFLGDENMMWRAPFRSSVFMSIFFILLFLQIDRNTYLPILGIKFISDEHILFGCFFVYPVLFACAFTSMFLFRNLLEEKVLHYLETMMLLFYKDIKIIYVRYLSDSLEMIRHQDGC